MTDDKALPMLRASDAMLRSLGGADVKLRLLVAPADDSSSTQTQLGLAPCSAEDVELAPALVSAAREENGRVTFQVLVSATAIRNLTQARSFSSAAELVATALGLVLDDELLAITNFTAELVAGTPVLYVLTVTE
jgi:hypothetical protein